MVKITLFVEDEDLDIYLYHEAPSFTDAFGTLADFEGEVKKKRGGGQNRETVCSARYHLALAEKGDTRCGACGFPLRV